MTLCNRILKEESGVLTFEWILLLTVLVIGITGGLSAVRDAMITELGDVAEAMIALDQSYYIAWPWEVNVPEAGLWDGAAASYYKDSGGIYQYRIDSTGNASTSGFKPHQAVSAAGSADVPIYTP